jgi:hypothetical protein
VSNAGLISGFECTRHAEQSAESASTRVAAEDPVERTDLIVMHTIGGETLVREAIMLTEAVTNSPLIHSSDFRYAIRSPIWATFNLNCGIAGCPVAMPSASDSARDSTG